MRPTLLSASLLATALLAGCSQTDVDDERDSDFISDGKADGAISEGSPEALGVLAVVNELTQQQLDNDVGLHATAAKNIAKHRAGGDGALGTSDDDSYDTLAELDAVPYVGPVAFGKLLAYAQDNGYVVASSTWTMENPKPDNQQRSDVWAITPSDAWAVGSGGLVEHWNGSAWTDVSSGVTADLYAVWAANSSDVWIVGAAGTVLRWNGSALSQMTTNFTQPIYDVHGTGPNDVWLAGEVGIGAGPYTPGLRHWNGSTLTTVKALGCSTDVYTVYAVSPSDVWAGGSNRTACHFDGTAWTDKGFAYPYQDNFTDLWASSTLTLAVFSGSIYRYDGAKWVHMYSPPDAEGWISEALYDLRGTSDSNIWASGSHGYVAHYDGNAWSETRIPGNADYVAVTTSGPGDAWAVGLAARARLQNGSWTETYDVASREWLWSSSGTSPNNLWALGSYGDIIRRTASGWSRVDSPFSRDNDFTYAVHAISSNDVWFGGAYNSAHWDGQSFALVPDLHEVKDFWSTSSTSVWAVGEGGLIAHYDGSTWTKPTGIPYGDFYAIAGTSDADVWIGGKGSLYHFDGSSWTRVESGLGTYETISTIQVLGSNDIWIAGESKMLRHFDGTTWTAFQGTTESYTYFPDSYARASNDVWFVLARKELVHWNGTTLEHESIPGIATIEGFGSTLFTTGEDGIVLRR
jgi:hypothetical protein